MPRQLVHRPHGETRYQQTNWPKFISFTTKKRLISSRLAITKRYFYCQEDEQPGQDFVHTCRPLFMFSSRVDQGRMEWVHTVWISLAQWLSFRCSLYLCDVCRAQTPFERDGQGWNQGGSLSSWVSPGTWEEAGCGGHSLCGVRGPLEISMNGGTCDRIGIGNAVYYTDFPIDFTRTHKTFNLSPVGLLWTGRLW